MAFNIFATATSDIPLANLDANFTMIGSSAVASTLYPTATTSITYGTTGTTHYFSGSGLAVTGTLSATLDANIYGVTVGRGAGAVATNTVVGASALAVNTTGSENVAIGSEALNANTTGARNTAVAWRALFRNTTGTSNVAVGVALPTNTTGSYNTAVGDQALQLNTTASNNTAVGYQAGYSNQTGAGNTFVGQSSGYAATSGVNTFVGTQSGVAVTTGERNTLIGHSAGFSLTTGSNNTFIGVSAAASSGSAMTTGSRNTILGGYSGNQGGLDIRTANNHIVLSDGDGNPREYITNAGTAIFTVDRTSSTNAISLVLSDNVTGAQTNGVYKSIRSQSNGGSSISEIRFIETDGTNNNTAIAFATANTAGNLTEKMRVLNTGAILALSGASTTATGTGIGFPGTQSASSDANTLDDYEEGNWTPSYTGTSGDPTVSYITRTAKYVKIGKQVTAWCYVYISSTAGGGGNIYLSGLPFTCTGVQGGAFNNWTNNGWTTQAPQGGHVPTGQTYVMLTYYIATGTAQVPVANLANACELTLCVTYQTD